MPTHAGDDHTYTRRGLLTTVGALAGTSAVAGCLGGVFADELGVLVGIDFDADCGDVVPAAQQLSHRPLLSGTDRTPDGEVLDQHRRFEAA